MIRLPCSPCRQLPRRFFLSSRTRYLRTYASAVDRNAPLRILFCGSDRFSAVSLQRLAAEKEARPDLIQSIDVVCKTGKPSGRGLTTITDSPVKTLAKTLGLPLYEIPTFTGWAPPTHQKPSSVIIAVSFGLKVPARILDGAHYGGLNVHPSLLPDLRGPAPMQHTLLRGDRVTGVTIQTLDPHRIDHGSIVRQQSFDVPNHGICVYEDLHDVAAEHGQQQLVKALESIQAGHQKGQTYEGSKASQQLLEHAPKLEPGASHVDWTSWHQDRILQSCRALGSLWSLHKLKNGATARIQWHDLEPLVFEDPHVLLDVRSRETIPTMVLVTGKGRSRSIRSLANTFVCNAGIVNLHEDVKEGDTDLLKRAKREQKARPPAQAAPKRIIAMRCHDGNYVTPRSVTVEGRRKHEDPAQIFTQILPES